MPRFELIDGNSAKFWSIERDGATTVVQYGKIGTDGRRQEKSYPDEAAAIAAVEKQIKSKTRKGYAEVSAPTAPASATAAEQSGAGKASAAQAASASAVTGASATKTSAARPSAAKKPVKKPAKKAAKKAAPKAPKIPELVQGGHKLGSRKLANMVKKLVELKTFQEVRQGLWPIFKGVRVSQSTVLNHLLIHGALPPTGHLGKQILSGLRARDCDLQMQLRILREADDAAFQALPLKALAWIAAVEHAAPAELDALVGSMAEPLEHAAALVRFERIENPTEAQRRAALDGLLQPIRFAQPAGRAQGGVPVPVPNEELAPMLVRIGGPDWPLHGSLHPVRLLDFATVLGPALAGRPLSELVPLLGGQSDLPILLQCEQPAADFFAAAAAHEKPWGHEVLTVVGMARATRPEEIPAGTETGMGPDRFSVRNETGVAALNALGPARLAAWAEAQATREHGPNDLRKLWSRGVAFGEATLTGIILALGPFPYSNSAEHLGRTLGEQWIRTPATIERNLPRLVQAAQAADGPLRVAFARWIAGLIARLPEDANVPTGADALFELETIRDTKATSRALKKLSPSRAEGILWRAAPKFDARGVQVEEGKEPYRELRFFRPRLSDRYLDRVASLLLRYQNDAQAWSDLGHGGRHNLERDAMRLAEAIARQVAGAAVSETLLRRTRDLLGEAAADRVRAVAASAESVADEMRRLAAALPGPHTPIYLLRVTEDAATAETAHYTGGRPRGLAQADIPRSGTRRLRHAFTLSLADLPELAARYPEAATLSFYVRGYSQYATRSQALLPLGAAQIAAEPGDLEGARVVQVERLEVPEALFAEEVEGDLEHLRGLVYRLPGFLLGGPIWLQDGPSGTDPRFLAQYDERLADGVNLGDCGIAYSFEHRCLWQCH